ncbi:butyrophilin-like protein 2 [Poeciliopsis prolifica]|uniref:butyrophilin-like protein 2 n=1 Tax=Poeciliopsis prolifica TaxID=188132 RepID=UPI002413FFC0|nr:butyrophilin-like protein 2 [Poeciliopsis prolifica]
MSVPVGLCEIFFSRSGFWTFLFFVVLLWTPVKGSLRLIGSSQPIVAAPGDDVILPCRVDPEWDAVGMTVEWSRPDLRPSGPQKRVEYVFVYRFRKTDRDMMMDTYIQRTSLSQDGLRRGDLSLTIRNVSLQDHGRFRCFIPRLGIEAELLLVVDPNVVSTTATETVLPRSLIITPTPQEEETSSNGSLRLIGSSQPIVAAPGDDVILPCRVDPEWDAVGKTVEWSRPDLRPSGPQKRVEYVFVYRFRKTDRDMMMDTYIQRTSLSQDGLRRGDVSLTIRNVSLQDHGRFRCFIPRLGIEAELLLVVDPNVVSTTATETVLPRSLIITPTPQEEETSSNGHWTRFHLCLIVFSFFIICMALISICIFRKCRQMQKAFRRPNLRIDTRIGSAEEPVLFPDQNLNLV